MATKKQPTAEALRHLFCVKGHAVYPTRGWGAGITSSVDGKGYTKSGLIRLARELGYLAA
jgi:hypothetical protein